MIRFWSHKLPKLQILSHRPIHHFSKPNFSDEYLKNLKGNLSDFQNTFGFDESLREKRLDNLANEKRLLKTFTVFGVFVATIGTFVFLTLFDREGTSKVKRSYYTHTTNIKLGMIGILPKSKAITKKIACIRNYVDRMSESSISNSRFSCLLLRTLHGIVIQILGDIYVTKIYARGGRDYQEEIENVLYLTQELLKAINPKMYKEDMVEGVTEASCIVSEILQAELQEEERFSLEAVAELKKDIAEGEVITAKDRLLSTRLKYFGQIYKSFLMESALLYKHLDGYTGRGGQEENMKRRQQLEDLYIKYESMQLV